MTNGGIIQLFCETGYFCLNKKKAWQRYTVMPLVKKDQGYAQKVGIKSLNAASTNRPNMKSPPNLRLL